MRNFYENLTNNKVLRPLAITLYIIIKRGIPIILFALLLGISAYAVDRYHVRNQPGEDFVNYYAFDVQNAREGEDVYFKVCRKHDMDYRYNGSLTVYVYKNNDPKSEPFKVFARDIKGNVRGDCENKVLLASDYYHNPGTYKMGFCVDFKVKYDIGKTVCKDSNIYKVYSQPTDISSRIKYYEQQLKTLREQFSKATSSGNTMAVDDQSLRADSGSAPTVSQQPSATVPSAGTINNGTNSGGGTNSATTEPQGCVATIPLLGTKLLCATNND